MPGKRKAEEVTAAAPAAKVPKIAGASLLHASLHAVYDLDFPNELLVVWECAGELCPDDPLNAFQGAAGLHLVGPFEVLSSRTFHAEARPHLHWRYPYDPPEFMTLATGVERHWGYFRDDPAQLPVLVASCTASGYEFSVEGDTFIGVLHALCKTSKPAVAVLEKAMSVHVLVPADARRVRAQRQKRSLGQPFHGLGLVVPYDPKTEVGYRGLGMTPAKFKDLLQHVVARKTTPAEHEEFNTLLTFVDVANDECDFGHGLEVGLDLLCFAALQNPREDPLHSHCVRILDLAYMLLGRALFQTIIQEHMADRRRPLEQPMD